MSDCEFENADFEDGMVSIEDFLEPFDLSLESAKCAVATSLAVAAPAAPAKLCS